MKKPKKEEPQEDQFPGYPPYPPDEDIYRKFKEEPEIDPENPDRNKASNDLPPDAPNEQDYDSLLTGDDLDVPGEELDDEQEDIGSEDEENNYYSLGGDRHED